MALTGGRCAQPGVCSHLCSCDVRVTSQAKFEPKLGREAPPSHDDRYKAAVALAEMVGFEVEDG